MGKAPLPASALPNARERRRTVEERLARLGTPGSDRRTPPPEGRLGQDEQRAPRLAHALADLGPVFAGFGRYLATRLDLLPRRDCLELDTIPDTATPLDRETLESLVRADLGVDLAGRFHAFEVTPVRAGLFEQRHSAWLVPGVPVSVTVVRPEAEAALQIDGPLLVLLQPWLRLERPVLEAAIADFTDGLTRRLNQEHQATVLAALANDARRLGDLRVPSCYADRSGRRVLTTDRLEGPGLAELLAENQPKAAREDAGKRLCTAWLRLMASGRMMPYELSLHDVLVAPDGVAFIGGTFQTVAGDRQVRFLNYLQSAAADDADACCDWVVADARPGPGAVSEEELKRRFRQAVPFRDVEWSGDDRLTQQLLAHWRVAAGAGWIVSTRLARLYRGLHAVCTITEQLAPGDVLLTSLRDERLRTTMADARQSIGVSGLPGTLDKVLMNMVNLPQKIDEVLSLAADGRLRLKLHLPEASAQRQARNRTVSTVASLTALIGVAFAMKHVAPQLGPGSERAGALLLLALGGWLVAAAARL